jgi:hypothetical protein
MFICQGSGGICAQAENPPGWLVVPSQLQAPLDLPLTISAPVGYRGSNVHDDVVKIQRALNMIVSPDGGADPLLKVDGICGQFTIWAIEKFQRRHFGPSQADGLIEPGRQTLAKLNELLAMVIQTLPTIEDLIRAWGLSPEHVLPHIHASFELAKAWASGARSTLRWSNGAAALLQRWFLFDRAREPANAERVSLIFERMNQFFARPGGLWGEQAFQPEPVLAAPSDNIAFCTAGGFFRMGEVFRAKHNVTGHVFQMRNDTIYFSFRFVLMSTEQRAYAIVHELAHFVSGHPDVTDHGYFHRNTAQPLTKDLRLANADCYSMLAYDAATGNQVSPFVWNPA